MTLGASQVLRCGLLLLVSSCQNALQVPELSQAESLAESNSVPQSNALDPAGDLIRVEVLGQVIRIEAPGLCSVGLRLHDRLIDLDQAIRVQVGAKVVFEGRVARTKESIRASLQERCDRAWAASARLDLAW